MGSRTVGGQVFDLDTASPDGEESIETRSMSAEAAGRRRPTQGLTGKGIRSTRPEGRKMQAADLIRSSGSAVDGCRF